MSSPSRGNADGSQPRFEYVDDDAVDATAEELLQRVLEETVGAGEGKAYFPIVTQFACQHRDRSIEEPEIAAGLIHEILDYYFGHKALPVNCHHWIAAQLLDDDAARERLRNLWQQAVKAGDDVRF